MLQSLIAKLNQQTIPKRRVLNARSRSLAKQILQKFISTRSLSHQTTYSHKVLATRTDYSISLEMAGRGIIV